jgi:hypothetical protein
MTKGYLFKFMLAVSLVGIVGISAVFAQDSGSMPKDTAPPTDSTGTYTRKGDKATDSLSLTADNKAVWKNKAEGKDEIVLEGMWQLAEDKLTVTIPAKEGGKEASVTFKMTKDGLEVTGADPVGILPLGTKFLKEKT